MFPAPAGINRPNNRRQKRRVSVPRASGDKPRALIFLALRKMCSPRQRG
ncbi:hypothetical protein CIT292_09841 [Citrobacter youngae ATCC 29220]|uniref:Uncharacterized protein n=1 Tax=Citrobacter youngae ATCC 29220 TaxID=500640 RepID=D4BH34_9ENTR|nr:hypothetical protein CIT292_09841 [Citrobacter youngae ATCC 29220]